MDGSKFSQAMQGIGGAAGVLGSWAGAYMGVPKAESNKRFMKKANMVGNWRYGASDMAGLMSQWRNTPTLQNISGKDLYDPSSEELFASMAGAGATSYAAMSGLTAPLKGKLGSTQIGGNSANAPGTTPSHVDTELMQNEETREEQFDIAEQAATNPLEAGVYKDMSVAAANTTPEMLETGEIYDENGNKTVWYNKETGLNEPMPTPVTTNGWQVTDPRVVGNTFGMPRTQACGGHLHGCGGHKYAMGGMSFDNGSATSMALNLASAGIGIGLSYAGTMAQKRKAEMEAKEVNAANLYAQQLQKHNFDEAVNDTKNNMFRQQALQMMALGGDLQTQGADFPLFGDFNIIGAGGTHEQNPFGGVFQGIAQDGQANLVEEDEVVWNDYVFSNRIKIPTSFADDYKLKEGITYAEAAKKLSKEAGERPNDPISHNGLSAALGALMQSQEEVKAKREEARMKRAIAKMSPEEIMNMLGALGGGQQFAEGGVLDGYSHIFAKGGSKGVDGGKGNGRAARKAADAAAARDKGLYNNLLGNLPTEVLRDIASQLPGYNADNFNNTNADSLLRQFISEQYGSTFNSNTINFDYLNNYIAGKRTAALRNPDDEPYDRHREVTYDNSAYEANRIARDSYSHSRNQGNSSGTYTYEGSEHDAAANALEGSEEYIRQTDYILEQLDRMKNGQEYNADFLERYFTDIDNNVPIAKGSSHGNPSSTSTVRSFFQRDENGNILRDANGRALYADDIYGSKGENGHWTGGRYWDLRTDGKRGMVHQPFVIPTEVVHNPGERYLVRLRGADGNFQVINMTQEQIESNPYFRKLAQNGKDTFVTDENGDTLTTHYLDYEAPEYQASYTPEEEPLKNPPLQTWPRYMPVLGSALGALAASAPAKDYSTGFSPRNAHYAPIGDYLPYMPVDTQRYINAENQQAAAQLNAIMNASAGNRNMAMAQAALANQQRQQGIGQRMQAAEQINWDRLRQAGEFNRGTNMFNAQAHNQAELANLHNNPLLLRQEQQNARMRHAVDNERDAAISASLNALFDNLGDIGRENLAWNQANSNEALRYFSDPNWLMAGASGYKKPTNAGVTETVTVGAPSASALGGYLLSKPTKKNRR